MPWYAPASSTATCSRPRAPASAGLDTRAFRLPWPDQVRLYELDLPEVLAFKNEVLSAAGAQPRCRRSTLAVSTRRDWRPPLLNAGLNSAVPTAWLAEGLLIYLSAAEAATLLTSVSDLSARGTRLAFEDELGTQRLGPSPGHAGDAAVLPAVERRPSDGPPGSSATAGARACTTAPASPSATDVPLRTGPQQAAS